jgi:NO-binding membrane sensor protein with MHYT domain
MKIGTTPVAVEYGVVLTATSVPVAIACFQFAELVSRVYVSLQAQVTGVAMVLGG